ncbi:hypothetical protein SDC9_136626 [bioreactor metagenome]|uniref:Uncharacterized protein n=1 Tax=bioreactor metagenome TaxID=1076179 RepID=A0A645DJR8_9ZZZZ
MREIIEVMAKALVDHPEQIVIREVESDQEIVYQLTVASEDMGKVIGHQGRIAKAMRTLLKATNARNDKRVQLDIVDRVTEEQ